MSFILCLGSSVIEIYNVGDFTISQMDANFKYSMEYCNGL